MPSLPSVEEAFIADMTRFLSGLDAGIAKAEEFAQACKNAADGVAEITLAAEEMAAAVDASFASAIGSAKALDAQLAETAATMGLLSDKHVDISASVSGISGPVAGAVVQLNALAAAEAAVGDKTVKISTDMAGAGAATAAATGLMWRGFRITGNAIHWLIMGTLEIAATAIPALVALGAAVVALYPSFVGISDRMNALLIASGSLSGALRNSAAPLSGLATGLGSLRGVMNSDAFVIFGSVIQDITSKMGVFSGMAQSAARVLTDFAVKITADLQGQAGQAIAGFFQNSVKYMIQWGQVLGNLGHAFLNIVNSMFGVGQILLDVLVALSRAFLALTSNKVAATLIGIAAAMSAVYRYGKLMVTIFNWLGGSALVSAIKWAVGYASALAALAVEENVVAAASLALGDLMTVALGPVGIAIGAIAAVLGIWYLATRNQATATTNLISKVQAMPPTVQNLAKGIEILNAAQIKQARSAESANAAMAKMRAAGQGPINAGRAGQVASNAYLSLAQRASQADQAVSQLNQAMQKQYRELVALETGLAQTGAGAGAVGHYMDMIGISTALADTKLQAMNQAFSDFMANVTGGEGGLASFSQSLQNITSVQATTGINNLGRSTATATLSVKQFAEQLALGAVKGSGAWNNFVQVMGSTMPNLVAWLNTARTEGALTGPAYSKAVLDMASSMTGFAKDSPAAQAVLVAFAQAQDKNIHTFPQLMAAIKDSGANMKDLQGKVNGATIAMSDLSQIARNMSSVLNSQVQQAIAEAAIKASGLSDKLYGLAKAEINGSFRGKDLAWWQNAVNTAYQNSTGAAAKAAGAIKGTGDNAQTSAGQARTAALNYWNLNSALNALNGKNVVATVTVHTVGNVTALFGGGLPGGTVGGINPKQKGARGLDSAQRGVALVGELGPELVFMRGGEQVIPHDVSRALMSMAGHLPKVTGYAGGTGGFWDKIIDKVWQDFQRILNRILGRGRPDPQYAAIQHLENEVRREFRDHKISKREELRLLKRLESIDDRLEFLAARHAAQKALGRDITGLLAEFAPKHHAPVAPAIQALLNLVKKDQSQGLISDRKADWLTAWLDHENKRLEKLLSERARLAARLRTVRAYEAQVSQAAQQQASLAGVISGLGGGPQSSATLLAGMQQQLAQIRRFDADIKKLSKLGLDKALINQIVQMGPAQGSQVAEALINGPLANIAALNKTETQVQKASAALGNTAATAVYGSGKDFGKNFLKGLRAEEKAIEAEMARIARNMVQVLERALGLHHRRAHHAGAALMAAVAGGAADRSATDSALGSAAGYVPSALASAAAGGAGGGAIRLDLTIHNYTDVDGKQVYKSVQERSLRIDRRNGRNNLSLTAGRRR